MKTLTIVAYIGQEYTELDLINSLKKQEIFSEEKTKGKFKEIPYIQCIIMDSVGEEGAGERFRQNQNEQLVIDYELCKGESIAQCYNHAMNKIKGEYVAFVDIDSIYSPKAIWHLCEILENDEIADDEKKCVCIKPVYVRPDGNENVYKIYPGTNGVRDVSENTMGVNLCLYSYFIRKSVLEKMSFHEDFPVECRTLFCVELLEKIEKYDCKNGPSIRYFHPLEDAKGLFGAQHHKEWYTKTIRECYIPFLLERKEKNNLTYATEAVFFFFLYIRFSYNVVAADNEVLSETEINEFRDAAYELCSLLSFETLLLQYKVKNQKYASWLLWKFMEAKILFNNASYKLSVVDGTVFLRVTDQNGQNSRYALYNFNTCKATVYVIDYEEDKLTIDLSLEMLPEIITEQLHPEITVTNGTVNETQIYNEKIYFGRKIGNPAICRAVIPIMKGREYQQFRFQVKLGEESCNLICNFAKKPAARLTASCSENYWHFGGNRILQYQPAKQRFIVEKCTQTELMSVEQNYCRAIKLDRSLTPQERVDLIEMRRAYWKEKTNLSQKPIWITYDKLYKGGDNGEYLFHYIRKNCPDVDIYYLLTETSADYQRLKEDDHVLIHGTKEAKLKVLQAQLILATHTNTMSGCGFTTEGEKRYLKNLYNAEIVCIQHGLTVQDIAIWQNIVCDNTKLYCCASKNEIKNILQPSYGYTQKEVRLTGLARYDGLVSKDERQILITPTWRRNLVNAGSSGNVRAKNNFFKDTEYFKIYNNLINDERLIACAKKYNYRIMYLIHPTLSAQIDDFDKNEYVDIVAAAGDMSYEKVLTESSLMITDYSGVQFDFAYMRKPVLYYHPASLPPHYTESIAFQYASMGFGPMIDNHEELVSQICAYMEKDCSMDPFYRKRADEFFAFSDTDNCKRITDAIMEYAKELESKKYDVMAKSDKYDLMKPEPVEKVVKQSVSGKMKKIVKGLLHRGK